MSLELLIPVFLSINPIDTPVFSTTIEDRPMLRVLLESEEGRKLYCHYLYELVSLWIDSGDTRLRVSFFYAHLAEWEIMLRIPLGRGEYAFTRILI